MTLDIFQKPWVGSEQNFDGHTDEDREYLRMKERYERARWEHKNLYIQPKKQQSSTNHFSIGHILDYEVHKLSIETMNDLWKARFTEPFRVATGSSSVDTLGHFMFSIGVVLYRIGIIRAEYNPSTDEWVYVQGSINGRINK
jgi:hypothetical protein